MVVFGVSISTKNNEEARLVDNYVEDTSHKLSTQAGMGLFTGKGVKVSSGLYLFVMTSVVPKMIGVYVSLSLMVGGSLMYVLLGANVGLWLTTAGLMLLLVWSVLFNREFYFLMFKTGLKKRLKPYGLKVLVEDATDEAVYEVLSR